MSALQAGAGDKEAYQAVFRYQEQARLPGLKAPTLLISGEIDLFHGCLETTRDLIPDCEVGVIPGGDGLVTADRTPEFAALTLAFLKRIGYV